MCAAERSRPADLDRVLEEVLDHADAELPGALDRACADHPELADDLRRRVDHLHGCGVLSTPPSWSRLGPGAKFGDYELVRPLGTGGMGLVFLARHRQLGREVALKIVRPDYLATDRARERFLREAQALAQVEHPALCTVFETGEHDGTPFLAMRYVQGRSLDEWLEDARRGTAQGAHSELGLPNQTTSTGDPATATSRPHSNVAAIVALLEKVARGTHAAHEAGIVHRDIKPANVVIDENGEPVLLDFGLAKHADSSARLTQTGVPLGTPAYMAPEQVRVDGPVDRRTDVYALGGTLYECLTLRPPHVAADRESLYREILTQEPPDPRRFNRNIPRDLSVTVAKALEKEARRRYPTGAAFADDLARILRREPIDARPPGALRLLHGWARRHPVAATLIAALSMALVVFGWLIQERNAALRDAEIVRLVHESEAAQDSQPVTAARLAREAWLLRDDVDTRSRLMAALADLHQMGQWQGSRVRQCAVSPDRHWLAEARAPGGVVLRNLADGTVQWETHLDQQLIYLEWSPDSRQLVTLTHDSRPLAILDCSNGDVTHLPAELGYPAELKPPAYRPQPRLAYMADQRFVFGDAEGGLHLFDGQGTKLRALKAHDGPVYAVRRRPGHGQVLSVGADGRAALWDGEAQPEILTAHHDPLRAAAFSPDGRFAAVGSSHGWVAILDLEGGSRVEIPGLMRAVVCLEFSPDGSHLLVSTLDPQAGLWKCSTGELRKDLGERVQGAVWTSCFLPNGWLAIAGRGGTIWIYDACHTFCFPLHGPSDFTSTLQARPGGGLISGSWDGTVRAWHLDVPEFPALRGHDNVVLTARWSGDGEHLVSAGIDGRFGVWDLANGTHRLFPSTPQRNELYGVDRSADGSLVATAENMDIVLWRRASGGVFSFEREDPPRRHGDTNLWGVKLSPDGNHIVSYGPGDAVKRWNAQLDLEQSYAPVQDGSVLMASVDSKQRYVACVAFTTSGSYLNLWDYDSGAVLLEPVHVPETAWSVEFSPDGRHLLLACADGQVSLRGLDGREVRRYRGPEQFVRRASFSPDGEYVLAGSQDGTVWLWQCDGKLVARLPHEAILWWTEFAPDGKHFLSTGTDGVIRIWPMPTEDLGKMASRIDLAGR